MNRILVAAGVGITLITAITAGCGGGPSIEEELAMVPGLCFLHLHVDESADLTLLPESLDSMIPLWLCDSLGRYGDFGMSLLGVNLTDLKPQLMFLSSSIGADDMADIGAEGFQCSATESGSGYDLLDSRGSILGSVAARDGWTCMITGSGSDRAADRWLSMDGEESLAADSDLVSIARSDADMNTLISRNSIGFLSVIPTGMLDRQQIAYLNLARSMISDLGVRAARLSINVTDQEPRGLFIEFQLVRENGNVATISAGFSDTAVTPDSLITTLTELFY